MRKRLRIKSGGVNGGKIRTTVVAALRFPNTTVQPHKKENITGRKKRTPCTPLISAATLSFMLFISRLPLLAIKKSPHKII